MSISREEMVLLIDQCKATDTPIKQNPSDNSEGVVNNFIATFIKWSGLFFENEPIVKISQSKDGLGRLTSEIREPQSLYLPFSLSLFPDLVITFQIFEISLTPRLPFHSQDLKANSPNRSLHISLLAVYEGLELHRDNIIYVIVLAPITCLLHSVLKLLGEYS